MISKQFQNGSAISKSIEKKRRNRFEQF